MNIEIESQILCQEEIEKFRRLYEIVDEDDIEEVKLERALFLFCGRRLPSIDACRREKSRVDTVEVLTSNIMRSCFFNLSLILFWEEQLNPIFLSQAFRKPLSFYL